MKDKFRSFLPYSKFRRKNFSDLEFDKLGRVFGETIISTSHKCRREIKDSENLNFKNHLVVFYFVFIIAFLIIILRLFWLTIIKGNYYYKLSSQNRIKENIFPAPRGEILDRKGEVIVRNKPGFVVKVSCGERECFQRISHEEALKLEAEGKVTPFNLGVTREYIDNFAFSHVLGMVGMVDETEIGKVHCGRKLTFGDELGRSGVEEAFDCQLQGSFGRELFEVDAEGKKVRTLSKIEPKVGKSIFLSLDKRLQLKAAELMKDKTGVIIAHIPQTGELLVLYSSPSFNLNQFAEGLTQKEYDKLLSDINKPLFNRAIGGLYPPGSTIKPILGAAALEEKVIDKDTQIEDVGQITIGQFNFPNWYFIQYGKKEGQVDIVKAIKRSNDIYFYKVGELLGVEKIEKWLKKFFFGKKLGIGISGEAEGVVPNPSWKMTNKKEQWFLGDTYHLSIGQGHLLVTPLQIAFATGAFANNGVICRPSILKRDSCEKITDKLISLKNLEIIKEGMVEACTPGGTAYPFFNFKVKDREIKVACKTGTAEYGDPQGKTHAWFTAFAPVDYPQIAVTVLVEAGGEGSGVAAPIAKAIFEEWFSM